MRRQQEIERLYAHRNYLQEKRNPYSSDRVVNCGPFRNYQHVREKKGGPAPLWNHQTSEMIKIITEQIETLEKRTPFTEKELLKEETKQYFHHLILQELGIEESSFTESETKIVLPTQLNLTKTLTKKYPHTIVSKKISYY